MRVNFPGDKRKPGEIIRDINATLQRCNIDRRLIIKPKR